MMDKKYGSLQTLSRRIDEQEAVYDEWVAGGKNGAVPEQLGSLLVGMWDSMRHKGLRMVEYYKPDGKFSGVSPTGCMPESDWFQVAYLCKRLLRFKEAFIEPNCNMLREMVDVAEMCLKYIHDEKTDKQQEG